MASRTLRHDWVLVYEDDAPIILPPIGLIEPHSRRPVSADELAALARGHSFGRLRLQPLVEKSCGGGPDCHMGCDSRAES